MRAGHTEAGCDLARMAGLEPAAVICEIMKDDGTMARLPDLEVFAAEHGIKIGTIAALIEHRSRNETMIERVNRRRLNTAQGEFDCSVFRDRAGAVHLALAKGQWGRDDEVLVRVHEPLSIVDLLEVGPCGHSWPLPAALAELQRAPAGVAVLLNCGRDDGSAALLERLDAKPGAAPRASMDWRTHGIGAQILRELGVHRMRVLGSPRRLPSIDGFGLEVTGFLPASNC